MNKPPPYVKPQNGQIKRVVFPDSENRPCFKEYEHAFVVGSGKKIYDPGVYFHGKEIKKDEDGNKIEIPIDKHILSVVNVIGISRTAAGTDHSYLFDYVPHGGVEKRKGVFAQTLLFGRADDTARYLREMGVTALQCNSALIRTYMDQQHLRFSAKNPDDFWESAVVVGWHGRDSFVLPTEIIGKEKGVWYGGKGVTPYGKHGSFEKWKTLVAASCCGNPYLLFAVSCGFTGSLLELVNLPGVGFHFHGDSTSGKTTTLLAGGSCWGSKEFVASWSSTVNGLESRASSRSSTLTPLDESHLIEPKSLDAGSYLLMNGTPKGRMNKDLSAREDVRWKNCVLSSGERSIEAHLSEAKILFKAGQAVRMIDIPVTGKYGAFDSLNGQKSASLFSDSIRDAASENYGFAGPAFVKWLIEHREIDFQPRLQSVLAQIKPDGLNAQQERVARAFALVGLSGEMAIEAGIVPWKQGDAIAAVIVLFHRWYSAQSKVTGSREDAEILRKLLDFIETHKDSRFSDINWAPVPNHFGEEPKPPIIHNRAGYWDDSAQDRVYLFTGAGLREATKSFDFARCLKALEDAKAFTTRPDEKGARAIKRRVPPGNESLRLYHIDLRRLS